MSLNTNQVAINKDKFFFLLANFSTLTADNIIAKSISTNTITGGSATFSTIKAELANLSAINTFYVNAENISSQYTETNYALISSLNCLDGNISSIVTNNIVLDGNFIDTGGAGAGATLLLNGFPIVTGATSSFSTLADWSYFPAVSTLYMGSNNIVDAGNITCQNIYNALNIQTDTFNALTAITAPSATLTNIRNTNLSTVSGVGSNITVSQTLAASNISTGTIQGQRGTFGGVSSLTVSTGTARGTFIGNLSATTISTNALTAQTINGVPFISGSNWSQYAATSAVNMNGFALTNTTGQTFSITPTSNLNITTSNGNLVANYPVNITAGDVNILANSGSDVGTNSAVNITASNGNRGQINLTAQPGFAGVQGEINLTANGGSVGGVGLGGLITLTANTPVGLSNLTSAIKFSAAGVNSYAGAIPSVGSLAGYNFIYGTLGVNIAAGLPAAFPNAGGTVYLYGTNGVEVPSDAYMKNIYPYWDGLTTPPDLTINGRYIIPNLAQVCVRMSNVRQIDFQSNVGTYMSNCDNITMSANGAITTSNLTATSLVGTNNLNTNFINSIPIASYLNTSNISTFQTASISSLNVSTLNSGIRIGQKSIAVTGDVAQVQCSNTAGLQGSLNVLMRQNYGEIQCFNSNFTIPLNLQFTADNFGFNVNPASISGGYEMDISGNTQIRYGQLRVGFGNPGSIVTSNTVSTSAVLASTINGQRLPYPYGSFSVNANQTIGTPNTAVSTIFDTTEYANGISIVNGTSPSLAVSTSGLYRWIASPQFNTTSGGANPVSFWFQKNGSNIPRSASKATVANNATLFSAVEIYEQMNAQDTLSFCFTSSDTNMNLSYFPATGVVPANPALILNGQKIAEI